MLTIPIKFLAFIPRSLGKSLLSYFEGTSSFRLLKNKEEFTRKLRRLDSNGYTWLPEPLGFLTNHYFSTDNVDMYHPQGNHTARLAIELELDLKKIGNYHFGSEVFKHNKHGFKYGGIGSQHSGTSHQVKAYIKRIPFYTDMPRASQKDVYVGVCGDLNTDRSDEVPLKTTVSNSKKHFYTEGSHDTTAINVKASAGYPFDPLAPHIDFKLEIEVHKNLREGSVDLNIFGVHDYFPAYELIVRNRKIYSHNPSDYGHTGPGLINLNLRRNFRITESIRLSQWEIRDLRQM